MEITIFADFYPGILKMANAHSGRVAETPFHIEVKKKI